ncbi:hypothetical protein [Amycolatopsis benzoatilytica]|uniref:hypothetical protein n=1 Tax=Amycolatopsis benzoatilytica TaxID=346045 RepID=UPI000363BEF4|nr:hypothetical protein [Amycolatopsis benzoatilytica]
MANLSPQEIVRLVKSGKGSVGLYQGSDQSAQLSAQHEQIAGEMRRLQSSMSEFWQGDSAGQAYAGAGPLVQASQTSGQHLAQAQDLYQGQGGSFNSLQSKIQGVGDLGDKPANDWVSDTPLSFMSNRADEIDAWNKKAQIVTDSYSTYHSQSSDNSAQWTNPSQYGELALPSAGGDFTVTQPSSTGTGHLPTRYLPGGGSMPNDGYAGGGNSTTSSTGSTSTGSATDHTNDRTGPPGALPPSDTHPWGPKDVPPAHPPVDPPVRHSGGTEETTTSGYVPPDVTTTNPVNPWSPNGTGPNPTSGGGGNSNSLYAPGVTGPFGGAGGSDFSGGRGGSTGGPGGSGGAGNSLGRGAGAGTGAGSVGNAEAVGGKGGVAGAAGRPGASGMGGAMGHGKKGEGEDDLVHETADYLVEQDPDAALIGELPKAVPPVIGL